MPRENTLTKNTSVSKSEFRLQSFVKSSWDYGLERNGHATVGDREWFWNGYLADSGDAQFPPPTIVFGFFLIFWSWDFPLNHDPRLWFKWSLLHGCLDFWFWKAENRPRKKYFHPYLSRTYISRAWFSTKHAMSGPSAPQFSQTTQKLCTT